MLKVQLTSNDKSVIAESLQKLFMFQFKKISQEDLIVWVDEISSWSMPLEVIISGINAMYSEGLRELKLATIKQFCLNRLTNEQEVEEIECNYCNGWGIVTGVSPIKSNYTFRCVCSNGNKPANQSFTLWNGQKEMIYGKEVFKFD